MNRVFRIRPGILIPEGDYVYRRQRVSASSDSSRKISGGGSVEWGKFWDGESESFTANLSVKPNYRVNVDVNYARNQVDLTRGSFTTDPLGLRFVYAFTARAFFNAFIQYNAERDEVSSNLRFNILQRPTFGRQRAGRRASVDRQVHEPVQFLVETRPESDRSGQFAIYYEGIKLVLVRVLVPLVGGTPPANLLV